METSTESKFVCIPCEILVDLLLLIPTSSIISFYSVNSTHLKLFDDQHGLWAKMARKMFKWGALDEPSQDKLDELSTNKHMAINWKKEFRIAAFIKEKLHCATFTASYRPNFVTIDRSHIKGLYPVVTEDNSNFSVVQSDTILYPHPIGDFTTTYFEVKICGEVTANTLTAIGGALKCYSGVPGFARSSCGLSLHANVMLECEFPLLAALSHALAEDDCLGFGINFRKNSVFFTINGNLVHETANNAYDLPLQNLKTLHATVSLCQDEVSMNMGSLPFVFDLLKYQQQNRDGAKTPLKLFSEIIVPHLVAIPDEHVLLNHPTECPAFMSNRNLPKPSFLMPEFWYLISYEELPPNAKIKIEESIVDSLKANRTTLNSMTVLTNSTPDKHTTIIEELFAVLEPLVIQDFPHFNSCSWEEKLQIVTQTSTVQLAQVFLNLIELYKDELMSLTGDFWPSYPLALNDYLKRIESEDGEDNWIVEALHESLDPKQRVSTWIEFWQSFVYKIMGICHTFGWEDMIRHQADEYYQNLNELKLVMEKITCNDKTIIKRFSTMIDKLAMCHNRKKLSSDINKYEALDHQIKLIKLQEATDIENRDNFSFLTYGMFKLKISPDKFKSKEEYLNQVLTENKKLITKELEKSYLEECAKLLHYQTLPIYDSQVLAKYFKLNSDAPLSDLKLIIEDKLEEYNNKASTSVWSKFGQT